jgi:hypothetical protein
MPQEFEFDGERSGAMEQGLLFVGWQIRDPFQVEGNRVVKRSKHLLERAALDRDVEIEADRLPIAAPAFGVAVKGSVRQLETCRILPHQDYVSYSSDHR